MITTSYGNWITADQFNVDVEGTIHSALTNANPEDFDTEAIATDYRAAINAALPRSVSLCGNEFYGPADPDDDEFDGYELNEDGDLDIRAIIREVDETEFWAIVERHERKATETTVDAWEIGATIDGDADQYGITGATSDDELATVAQQYLADYRDGQGDQSIVISDLDQWLRHVRDSV